LLHMAEKLYLIDGHAQVHRAYHAYPKLASPSGEPTGAVFGFAKMFMALLDKHSPEYVVAVFDPVGPTERKSRYAEYKATRKPMPEDLRPQVERIIELCAAYNIPTFRVEGVEADDVIATLVKQAAGQGLDVTVVSGDKDLLQLVGGRVRVYDPQKDLLLDAAGVEREKGLKPSQIPDWIGLMGDASDNIPGVPGIGEKGARELIARYGSLEAVLEHAGEIKGKRGENLRAFAEAARASRDLAVLRTDVDVKLDLAAARRRPPDSKRLMAILSELRMQNLLKTVSAPVEESNADYVTVAGASEWAGFLRALRKQPRFAVDTETDGLRPRDADIIGLSFSWKAGQAYYIPLKGPERTRLLNRSAVLEGLRPILEDPRISKVGQNLKFDMLVLRRAGVELKGAEFDTMVASYLLNPGAKGHNIDVLAMEYLQYRKFRTEEVIGSGRNRTTMDLVPVETVARYACEDADIAWRLYEVLSDRIEKEGLGRLFREIEMPLVEVLADMEWTGVAVDAEALRKMSAELGGMMAELEEEIYRVAGERFNVNSPQQLREILYEKLRLEPPKKTRKTKALSTDAEALEELSAIHPLPKLILEYRSLAKLKGTYVDALPGAIHPATGRIHASFNQTQTATGRLSSSDPNIQNIPVKSDLGRGIRAAFRAGEPGWRILSADYSQIELRMLAHYSGDEALLKAFAEGEDIHASVAARLFNVPLSRVTRQQRARAKAVNFGIIYGQTAFGLAKELNISNSEAQRIIDAYFAGHPKVAECLRGIIASALDSGRVETILGRRRFVPELKSPDHATRKLGERLAVNTVFQGSAADLIKKAMVAIHADLRDRRKNGGPWRSRMIMQIHDELVFEAPAEEAEELKDLVKDRMEKAMELRVPLAVDVGVGRTWLEAK
ncbi:MAG: DNA polymerase I, partial [Planctomycetota bacterium]|nr:DNA polymerase I [Planctomycetota bacterium]